MRVDLNCDMGESFGRYRLGQDAAMLDVVTSANVACGLHAGDPLVMQRTVAEAAARGVAIGRASQFPGSTRLWAAVHGFDIRRD